MVSAPSLKVPTAKLPGLSEDGGLPEWGTNSLEAISRLRPPESRTIPIAAAPRAVAMAAMVSDSGGSGMRDKHTSGSAG